MKLFAYCRVSIKEETEDRAIENQKMKIKRFAKENGHKITEWFIDEGISGSLSNRPKFNAMIEGISKADGIICTTLDRFGRSLRQIITTVDDLSILGKQLICTDGKFDTETTQGKLQFQILAAFAEYERNIIRDRIRAGIERAKKEGVKFGCPKKHIPKKKLEILIKAEVPWAAIGRMFDMNYRTVQDRAKEYDLLPEDD